MKRKDLIRALRDAGYTENTRGGNGGHIKYEKPGYPSVIVPSGKHHKELQPGTLNSIFKKAGIRIDPDTGAVEYGAPVAKFHLSPGTPVG